MFGLNVNILYSPTYNYSFYVHEYIILFSLIADNVDAAATKQKPKVVHTATTESGNSRGNSHAQGARLVGFLLL